MSVAHAARVLAGDDVAGVIERTAKGAVFTYDPAFLGATGQAAAGASRRLGIAWHLPRSMPRVETVGVNLHTFFAGLLPEGIRLQALVQRVKTSADDLLSLLVAAGADCVGDVAVVPEGVNMPVATPRLDLAALDRASFAELLAGSLAGPRPGRPEPLVQGVQEKISAAMISLPVRGADGGGGGSFILKLNPPGKPRLVENEAFFMAMARDLGLAAASTRLVHDRDGMVGLLVERFDRVRVGGRVAKIHQEDACQLLDRYPADKYAVSCADVARALAEVCTAPVVAVLRFLELLAFSYMIGNGDLHAKNVSVAWRADELPAPTPAYDLLSTLPYGDRTMALKIDGRDDRLRRTTFVDFGARFGVRARAIASMLDRLVERAPRWLERVDEIGLDPRATKDLRTTMAKRREQLGR